MMNTSAVGVYRPAVEQLLDLWRGPVWDGNLISKDARDELVQWGYAAHVRGFNIITPAGVDYLASQMSLPMPARR